jgi:dihydroorotase
MKIVNGHVHAREQWTPEFRAAVPCYSADSAAVYMMNFKEPLDLSHVGKAVGLVSGYHRAIMDAAAECGHSWHRALVMPVLAQGMEPRALERFIKNLRLANIPLAGFKLFTQGQSTNSGYAPDIKTAQKLIDVLEHNGVNLALHMEDPDEPRAAAKETSAMERILPGFVEKDGRPRDMKISVEHISTGYSLDECLGRDLWFTITPHHMGLSLEKILPSDFASENVEKILREKQPYFYCKPIISFESNRARLYGFWYGGGRGKLMLGTDSAPHAVEKKEANPPAAGIYMGGTPDAYGAFAGPPRLHSLLEKYSANTADFYGLDMNALHDADMFALPGDRENGAARNVRNRAAAFFKGR